MHTDSFTLHFSALEDPRQSAKVSYPLFDILFLTLCAVMTPQRHSGARHYCPRHRPSEPQKIAAVFCRLDARCDKTD